MNTIVNFLSEKYSDDDFHNPYTDWSQILKTIEKKFIIRTADSLRFSNWIGNIKGKQYIRTISLFGLDQEFKKLENHTRYWLVLDLYGNPNEKHEVYGCTIDPLSSMTSMYTTGLKTDDNSTFFYVGMCFFILDSKLNWLTVFEVDKDKKEIMIFKSSNSNTKTPFDQE